MNRPCSPGSQNPRDTKTENFAALKAAVARGGSSAMRKYRTLLTLALFAPACAAHAELGNCGARVDARFTEAAALCGTADRRDTRTIELPDTTVASVPFAVRRAARRTARPTRTAVAGRGNGTLVHAVARNYRVDPHLLSAMVQAESGGRPDAISNKGALGLMQVMPGTARGLGVRDPQALLTSPTLALSTGALYLKTLQARFGNNLPLVVAAYNAGPGAVTKAGGKVPKYRETQGYVSTVMRRYAAARAA
jgi:soluble lytic murein transglycosylase-like protein